MTELYRGLLEIFVMRCIEQIESLRTHIRTHNLGKSSNIDFDVGVTGFWNFMLETVFTIFTVTFLMLAILLTAALAVASYPLAAFLNYGAWLVKNVRNPVPESPIIVKQKDDQEKK